MKFVPLELPGAYLIEPARIADERGYFARAWCSKEFAARGLVGTFVQSNISFNERAGTLRGMHRQLPPHEEVKLVRCTRGTIFDVIVDLRPHSPTFRQWAGVQLSAANLRMLYVPQGFAHGYQTLENASEVCYHVSAFYVPEAEAGVRWDDPCFDIKWPDAPCRTVSAKDADWPDFAC